MSASNKLTGDPQHPPDACDAAARQVRLLGEYHRGFQASEDPDGQDIADPLYGNANGPEEKVREILLLVIF